MNAEQPTEQPLRPWAPEANGRVLYHGRSHLAGYEDREVVVIMTGLLTPSKNTKTGDVVQVWALPADVKDLLAAVRRGDEGAACGDCRHRPSKQGSCYVNLAWAPLAIFGAWERGRYARTDQMSARHELIGRTVRFGAWGEMAAAPFHVFGDLLPGLAGWQGFTHAWRDLRASAWGFLMASVDTRAEALEAQAEGWRTFRVRPAYDKSPLLARERPCPASREMGFLLDCKRCGQCNGSLEHPRRPNRTILAHGPMQGGVGQLRLF